ncbi:MAG TPA: DUF615 domain-containing protein, partial [Gammaproteobacteria bacterium]|nr:DUF615 domain-containing protein [Gammaproteobacteria bacterium]
MMSHDILKDEQISRSQRKREAEAAQAIGERLLELSTKQLLSLNLPENLLDAVNEAKKIKAHGGRKRQLQYIGKLMRDVELTPIVDFFQQLDANKNQTNAKFKLIEEWRDRLLGEGNEIVQQFVEEHANADSQQLRQMIRNAKNKKNEKLA